MSAFPDQAPQRAVRFPLSAKILVWFLLNLAFLAVAAWIFARAQFRFGLDSLLAGPANDRVQTMAEILSRQLNERNQTEWPSILQSTAAAYHVQLALYRNDGQQVAGEITAPPPEVLQRIAEPRPKAGPPDGQRERKLEGLRDGAPRDNPPPDRPRGDRPHRDGDPFGERRPDHQPPPEDGRGPQPPPREGEPPPAPNGPGNFPKSILHTTHPSLYWVLVRLPVVDRSKRPPMPATLLLSTDSLRGGGLLFDFTPWLIGGSLVFGFSVLLWWPLVAGITRSLRQMTGAAEAIARGQFETRVSATRADEIGRLGTALNHMSGRLREFFTGQKRFLGDIAHELCSPLARMEMALGILDQRADEKQQAYVADVREELRHMSALVNELLSFSKAGISGKSVELKSVSLAELTARVIAREGRDRTSIVVDLPDPLSVRAEPELLARALGNVIRNALRYAAPGTAEDADYSYRPAVDRDGRPTGPITISARSDGPHILLSVTDCGPGVPEESLHRLFDPFFRPETARSRETGGAGLGLAIVKSCIEACAGTVTVRNVQPTGLQVEFRLSRAGE